MTWRCPRCGYVTEQPDRVPEVSHRCRQSRDRLVQLERESDG